MGRAHESEQRFPVPPDRLWSALAAALPRVTNRAVWYATEHKVEWSTDTTDFAWGQNLGACVEPAGPGCSILRVNGHSRTWGSLGDSHRRSSMFQSLVDGIAQNLAAPLDHGPEPPPADEVRWWDGRQWCYDPPPA